jgi:hypothetical protein
VNLFRLLLLLSILTACSHQREAVRKSIPVVLMPVKELSVEGNFLGDGSTYTLSRIITTNKGKVVTMVPNPDEMDWDSILNYYNNHNLQVRVGINQIKGGDKLIFDNAQGLYCLINMGDLDGDKRDEIGLVVDYIDFTNINKCVIYSYCHDKWEELYSFRIPEDVFSWEKDHPEPVFKEIPGYLQKQNGRWMFLDYETAFNSDEEHVPMKPLVFAGCN